MLSNASQTDLLSRTHPVRLTGTVMASSAVLPYMYVRSRVVSVPLDEDLNSRGLKYRCHSSMCPLNDRKRQKFVLFDIERPYACKVGE